MNSKYIIGRDTGVDGIKWYSTCYNSKQVALDQARAWAETNFKGDAYLVARIGIEVRKIVPPETFILAETHYY